MPLYACYECDRAVSGGAGACPQCGAPNPTAVRCGGCARLIDREPVGDAPYIRCRGCETLIPVPPAHRAAPAAMKPGVTPRGLLLAFGAVVVVLAGLALLDYGTVRPCGMLKEELMRYAMRDYVAEGGEVGALQVLGFAAGERAIEGMVQTLSPGRCFVAWFAAKTQGVEATAGDIDWGTR